MPVSDQDPILPFATQAKWEAWLAKQHKKSEGIWMKLYKKASGISSINYAQAVDGALCYGWIDGQKKSLDAESWLQRFCPRRPRSIWSSINKDNIARLTKAGKMKAAGLAQVEAAKADGRWEQAYGGSKTAELPADFMKRLAKEKKAHTFYKTLSKSNTYAIYFRLVTAKKPETLERRVQLILSMLAQGEKFH